MARCCSPCDEVQSRGGEYAIHDCLVFIIFFAGMANATQLDLGIYVLFNVLYDVLAFSRPFQNGHYR